MPDEVQHPEGRTTKNTRPTIETRCLGLGARVTTHRMMSRLEKLEEKKRLEKLHEFLLGAFVHQADETEVPANVVDQYHDDEGPIGVK